MKKENKLVVRSVSRACGLLLALLSTTCLAASDTSLADSLRNALQSQGWEEHQTEDGNMIYRRPTSSPKAENKAESTVDSQRARLAEALQERGWKVEWKQDGSLILRPKAEEQAPTTTVPTATETTTTGSSEETQSQMDSIPDLPGFRHWRIERGADGSMLFHPLKESESSETPVVESSVTHRCEGYQMPATDKVSLPVDEWSEARELARLWLAESDLEGAQVGKVRKVLRIYIVSIVESSAPYGLKHQLAIRASDGGVMLLE